MSRRISDSVKVDIAIKPQETTGVTSAYFKLDQYDRALFVFSITPVGASAIVSTSIATLYQATNASAGTSSAAIASSTAIVSIGTKATAFTITPATLSAGDTVTITGYDFNGDAVTALTFTASAAGSAGATTASRYFNINDTASGTGIVSTACTNLAALLNNATYGVPGLYASAASTNVTCRAVEPGENVFTLTSSSTANLALATTEIMGMCGINASSLTLSSNFTHVAINIVNQISAITSAFIIRAGRKQKLPVQLNGATTIVGY